LAHPLVELLEARCGRPQFVDREHWAAGITEPNPVVPVGTRPSSCDGTRCANSTSLRVTFLVSKKPAFSTGLHDLEAGPYPPFGDPKLGHLSQILRARCKRPCIRALKRQSDRGTHRTYARKCSGERRAARRRLEMRRYLAQSPPGVLGRPMRHPPALDGSTTAGTLLDCVHRYRRLLHSVIDGMRHQHASELHPGLESTKQWKIHI